MVYLLAISILAWTGVLGQVAVFHRAASGQARPSTVAYSLIPVAAAFMCSAHLVVSVFRSARLHAGKSVSADVGTWPSWVMLAGVLLTLWYYGSRLKALRKDPMVGTRTVGINVMCLACSAYLLFVVIDHAWFFHGPNTKDAGFTNWTFIQEMAKVQDVQCDAPTMLIRMDKNGIDGEPPVATYRCPTLLLLGEMSSEPLVPWPGYQEGRSEKLAKVLADLHRSAQ